jgi:hypothetical protein
MVQLGKEGVEAGMVEKNQSRCVTGEREEPEVRDWVRFVAPRILSVKGVSGGFFTILLGPTRCVKLEKLAEKCFSHLLSFPNLKESNGWGNTHTHA